MVWFVAIQDSDHCQVRRFVIVTLCIVVDVALAVVAFCVVGIIVTSYLVIVVGIIDNKCSMGELLGYVCHGYDAIVVVTFVLVVEFVHVGVYEW